MSIEIFRKAGNILYAENFLTLEEANEFVSLCEDFFDMKGGDPERIVFEVVDNYFRNADTVKNAKKVLTDLLSSEAGEIPVAPDLPLTEIFDEEIIITRKALKGFLTLVSRADKKLEVEYYGDIDEDVIEELLILELISFDNGKLKVKF